MKRSAAVAFVLLAKDQASEAIGRAHHAFKDLGVAADRLKAAFGYAERSETFRREDLNWQGRNRPAWAVPGTAGLGKGVNTQRRRE